MDNHLERPGYFVVLHPKFIVKQQEEKQDTKQDNQRHEEVVFIANMHFEMQDPRDTLFGQHGKIH